MTVLSLAMVTSKIYIGSGRNRIVKNTVCECVFLIIISNVMCKMTNQNEKDSTGDQRVAAHTHSLLPPAHLSIHLLRLLKTYEHMHLQLKSHSFSFNLISFLLCHSTKRLKPVIVCHPFALTTNDTESVYTHTLCSIRTKLCLNSLNSISLVHPTF